MGVERDFLEISINTWLGFESCMSDSASKTWHYHDQFELHYFWDFSGRAAIGEYQGALVPNSVFLLAPNIPHVWKGDPMASAGGRSVIDCRVLFREQHIAKALELFPELRNLKSLFKESLCGIEFSDSPEVREIGRLILELEHLEGCGRVSGFLAVLDRLARCPRTLLTSGNVNRQADAFASENLQRALVYIRQNFGTNITLEKVADVAVMSPSHFCRSFKRAFGVGFVEYLNKLRVECACERLRGSNRPIASIAYDCGFVNISNFNRNFRRYVNQSPSEFRRIR